MTDTLEAPMLGRIVCPDCHYDNTQCDECGNWTDKCECPELIGAFCSNCQIFFYADEEDYLDECTCETRFTTSLICYDCKVYRASMNDPWYPMYDDELGDEAKDGCECNPPKAWACDKCNVERDLVTNKWHYTAGTSVKHFYKCRHYDVELAFPDGVSVFASSKHNRSDADLAPDFGVYLDSYWYASCPAYFIDWPDYGLPTRWEVAARCIIDAYKKAENGLWVEVGCIGGHGRTGTVLACMAVLSGLNAQDSVNYVRDYYCNQAIESDEQEWYVEWFEKFVNGGTMTIKASQILGKKQTPDEEFTVEYENKANWREEEMIYASGLRPEKSVSELSKRKIVLPPKDDDDTDSKSQPTAFEYCDTCNMATPCLCYQDNRGSDKFQQQVEKLVEAKQIKTKEMDER